MSSTHSISKHDIQRAAGDLGIAGRPLCVHTSLRSFGQPVEGGATTIINGLLAAGCTVMAPTFSSICETAPPQGAMIPRRNGWNSVDMEQLKSKRAQPFDSDQPVIDREMGALPRTLLTIEGRWRGNHPIDSFSAVGPLAEQLIAGQQPLDVYAPFRELIDAGGWVLLIGVGLNRMTLIHHAEQVAGRELLRRWGLMANGEIIETQTGSCSEGFPNLEPVLVGQTRETTVGSSHWWAFPAAEVVQRASEAFRVDPQITHCDDPDCARCNDMVIGGTVI